MSGHSKWATIKRKKEKSLATTPGDENIRPHTSETPSGTASSNSIAENSGSVNSEYQKYLPKPRAPSGLALGVAVRSILISIIKTFLCFGPVLRLFGAFVSHSCNT